MSEFNWQHFSFVVGAENDSVMQLMASGAWWIMRHPTFLPSSCDHVNERKEPGFTVNSVFLLLGLWSTAYKRTTKTLVAFCKSSISFSHTRIPEESKPGLAWQPQDPRAPSLPFLLRLLCLIAWLLPSGSPHQSLQWWVELQIYIKREEEEGRGEGHKGFTLVNSVSFKRSFWNWPQKSTDCPSRTWSHDQASLKGSLGI